MTSMVSCIIFIIGLSAAMPGIMRKTSEKEFSYSKMTASIFNSSSHLGYIIIGLVAFVLGICFTIVCLRVRVYIKNEKEKQSKREDDNNRTV